MIKVEKNKFIMKATKNKFLIALCTFLGIMLISSCGIFTEVSISVDKGIDLSKYKTFAWLPDEVDTNNNPYNNELIRNNLKNYFGQNFAGRGFTIKRDAPDVLLQIVVNNKQRQKELIYPNHPNEYYYTRYYLKSRYYSPYTYEYYYQDAPVYCYSNGICVQQIEYVEGSITLNVIDRKLNKLVWSGTAKGDIYDPTYINKDIHPAVKRIMKKFPLRDINNKTKASDKDAVHITKN